MKARLPEPDALRIQRVGADGDGIGAFTNEAQLYAPYTLPGELVQPGILAKRGEGWTADVAVLEASSERVTPPCPHFGPAQQCGGCTLQHWNDAGYAAWKAGQVGEVLQRLGWDGGDPTLIRTPPEARRRLDIGIRRNGPAVLLGLHRRRSPEIVDMRACPILHPTLFTLLQALRPVLQRLTGLKRDGSAVMNLLESGPDLLLRTDGVLTAGDRTLLTAFAQAHGMPRISWAPGLQRGSLGTPEPACLLRPAVTALGGVMTAVPPGAFLQASREGEAAIIAAVLDAIPVLPAKAKIIELFAGCGSLTHALAVRGRVQAFEGDADSYAALHGARNPRVEARQRDLARQPLQAKELAAHAIVLDPPHGGAMLQMPALAASGVPVIYVSCNPAALLRDGRVLIQSGYRVVSAVAIDQFLWSARVESVVAFCR